MNNLYCPKLPIFFLLLLLPTALFAQPPSSGRLVIEEKEYSKTQDEKGIVDRGTLFVPENRSTTSSRTIALKFWRFRSQNSEGVPPIFILNGGPGWKGLDKYLDNYRSLSRRILPLLQVADVVVVGQRGIGSSGHTGCENAKIGENSTKKDQMEAIRKASEVCRKKWIDKGVDLSGLNVLEAAADVNEVREALGYKKILIWGVSFGSHWGMAIMRFFPEIVERAVLGGIEGPDHTYDSPTGILNALKRIAAEAESSPKLQPYIPEGGLLQAFSSVLKKLKQNPQQVKISVGPEKEEKIVTITSDNIKGLAKGYLGSVERRRSEASWPAGVLLLANEDYHEVAKEIYENIAEGELGMPSASFFMLDCGSGISPERDKRYKFDPAKSLLGEINWYYRGGCGVWNSDVGDDFRKGFSTDIPTLIIQGDWDLSTPIENAYEILPMFKNKHFVRVKRGSHSVLFRLFYRSETFRKLILEFFRSGDTSGLPAEMERSQMDWVLPIQVQSFQ